MTDKSLQAHDLSDVLEMAKACGFEELKSTGKILRYCFVKDLEAFANLIRADERINCIKIIGKELGLPDEYVAEHLSARGE